jgi:hypothetical protein
MVAATGQRGHLKYSYQMAARLGRWTLTSTTTDGEVSSVVVAEVDAVHAPWFRRAPLELYLSVGGDLWHWPVLSRWSSVASDEKITITMSGMPVILQNQGSD